MIGYQDEDTDDPEAVNLGATPAFTEDGSGYRADLFTLPIFGCVLHEAKE